MSDPIEHSATASKPDGFGGWDADGGPYPGFWQNPDLSAVRADVEASPAGPRLGCVDRAGDAVIFRGAWVAGDREAIAAVVSAFVQPPPPPPPDAA